MRLGRSFFARPTLTVARQLIGKHLVHRVGAHVLAGRIVETEAYIGERDQACHARFGGKGRAHVLYGPPGHAYVFLIYGMYNCFNVVTEAEGRPAAVLIRSIEPDALLNDVRTDGPGRLCRALSITRAHNKLDLCVDSPLWIEDRGETRAKIKTTARIGVDYAGAWAKKPWRFIDATGLPGRSARR